MVDLIQGQEEMAGRQVLCNTMMSQMLGDNIFGAMVGAIWTTSKNGKTAIS